MRFMTLKPVLGHYAPAVESKTHQAWRAMIQRCHQPSNSSYHNYGGRGISVCTRWRDGFENFLTDMGEPEGELLSLDRIDNQRGYEPGNCRWATRKEQGRNRRTNRFVDYFGERITVIEAAERSGLSHTVILLRIKAGRTGDTLFEPVRYPKTNVSRGKAFRIGDEMLTVQQIAKRSGVSAATIIKRIAAGHRGEALALPSARPYRFRPT